MAKLLYRDYAAAAASWRGQRTTMEKKVCASGLLIIDQGLCMSAIDRSPDRSGGMN